MNEQVNKIKEVGLEEYITNYFPKVARRKNIGEAMNFLLVGIVFIVGSLIFIFIRQGEHILDVLILEYGWFALIFIIVGLVGLFRAVQFMHIKTDVTSYKDELTKRHGDYKAALKEIESQLSGEIQGGNTTITTEDWLIFLSNALGVYFVRKSEIAGIVRTPNRANVIWDNGKLFVMKTSNWESLFSVLTNDRDNKYVLSNRDLITNAAGNRVAANRLIKSRGLDIFSKNKNSAKLIAKQYHENKQAGITASWANIKTLM